MLVIITTVDYVKRNTATACFSLWPPQRNGKSSVLGHRRCVSLSEKSPPYQQHSSSRPPYQTVKATLLLHHAASSLQPKSQISRKPNLWLPHLPSHFLRVIPPLKNLGNLQLGRSSLMLLPMVFLLPSTGHLGQELLSVLMISWMKLLLSFMHSCQVVNMMLNSDLYLMINNQVIVMMQPRPI